VYFQMGRQYKKLGDLERAQQVCTRGVRSNGSRTTLLPLTLDIEIPRAPKPTLVCFFSQALETALSFNGSSSDANMIKAAIEKLGVNEEEEEEEM
jgi:hypothetical protein